MSAAVHPAAPHHLPGFITAPGETDPFLIGTAIFLVLAVLAAGNFFLWLHSLPERMAHKAQKFQFELVAVLCLIALFTHIHLFWIIGLLLAFIDLPEIGKPLNRMAGAVEKIAGIEPAPESADAHGAVAHGADSHGGASPSEAIDHAPKSGPAAQPPQEAATLPPKGLAQAGGRS